MNRWPPGHLFFIRNSFPTGFIHIPAPDPDSLMFPYKIRPVCPEEDAADIALLVKESFRPWLDRENMDYLSQLHREGVSALQHPFLSSLISFPYRLDGVVCRNGSGALLGLINTYFFHLNGRRRCLIANVCVREAYRREGIASRMLEAVEKELTSEGVRDIFLQARLSAPETVAFYRRRGFCVTDYRETWVSPAGALRGDEGFPYRLERVPASDLPLFHRLMADRYPQTVLWNLNYKPGLFQTGLVSELINFLESPGNRFRRAVTADGRTAAWAAWQKLSGFADALWFVPAADLPEQEYAGLLTFLRNVHGGKRALKIDLPAGRSGAEMQSAPFRYYQTLAWMWKKL